MRSTGSDWVGRLGEATDEGSHLQGDRRRGHEEPSVAEAKKLLAEGFAKKTPAELLALFDHPHREVRQEAQFELVKRPEAVNTLVQSQPKTVTAKLHTIWCLGQVGMRGVVARYFSDASADVRRNAATVYGNARVVEAHVGNTGLVSATPAQLLGDADLGVRAAAVRAYAKFAHSPPGQVSNPVAQAAAFAPVFDLLRETTTKTPTCGQAAVEALVTLSANAPCELANAWKAAKPKSDHPAIRLGVVLALRKLQCPKLDEWLADADPVVAAEAARAIYDQELKAPMAGLAKLSDNHGQQDAIAYRALAANFRLGEAENANRVAAVAARASENEGVRLAALKLLEDWAKPKRLDPITGLTMNLGERSPGIAKQAVVSVLAKLFVGSDALRKQSATLTAKLGIQEVGPLMLDMVADAKQPVNNRVEALFALEAVKAKQLPDAAKLALASGVDKLRGAARVVNAKANPSAALTELPALVRDPAASVVEKQMAFAVMGTLKESAEIDAAVVEALDASLAGKLPSR